ncbi:hypothetical protein Acr_20g0007180 [Actinidia rufa]|uniref:Uncharacterized protein n=1 Tax=Actinidia rufa TaxID=165716 RepID=A0A7J0GDK6_9ERIC|nr:hypothetical protein Acr_20g0007180 [Actinidia rufa]
MDLTARPNPQLRRRNSIATPIVVPENLTVPTNPHRAATFPHGAAAAVDFELTIKPPSYTSLKDLLPPTAAVHSPTAAAPSGGEISIRNLLVKQAAWAYLQPMSASPDSAGRHLLRRLWAKISGDLRQSPVASFVRFITRTITRAFDWLVRAVRVGSFL